MALTVAPVSSGGGVRPIKMIGSDDLKAIFLDVTFDNSYASGGEALSATLYGLGMKDPVFVGSSCVPHLDVGGDSNPNIGVAYDYTNGKLVAVQLSSSTEYANTAVLSGYKARLLVVGF